MAWLGWPRMMAAADLDHGVTTVTPNSWHRPHWFKLPPVVAGAYGISGQGRVPGATGVWVQDRKIAAIGVKISHGIRWAVQWRGESKAADAGLVPGVGKHPMIAFAADC